MNVREIRLPRLRAHLDGVRGIILIRQEDMSEVISNAM